MTPRTRRSTRLLRALAATLVSAALLFVVFLGMDVDAAADAVRRADTSWLIWAAVASLAVQFARGARFSMLMPEIGYRTTTAAVGVQTFINRVAPFRLGELSLPYLLHRYAGGHIGHAIVRLALVRVVELALVLTMLVVAAVARARTDNPAWLALAALFAVGLLLLLARFNRFMQQIARIGTWLARVTRLERSPTVVRLLERLHEAADDNQRLSRRDRWALAAWSVVVLALNTLMFGAILAAFGAYIDPLGLALGTAIASAGPALPAPSVGSIGTLEASWVAGFVFVGLDLQLAIVTGVATQALTLLFAAVFAALCWQLVLARRV